MSSADVDEAMRLEFDWLLAEELPMVFMQLGQVLKACVKSFVPSKSGASTPIDATGRQRLYSPSRLPPQSAKAVEPKPVVARLSSKEGYVDGTVQLDGIKIVHGRLLFRIPKSSKTPQLQFRADILPAAPVLIRQAQAVLNNMRLTLLEIEETLQHQQLQTNSREQLLHVMSRLRGLLVKAKDNVVVSGRRLPEECMGQVSLLSPTPPESLVTDIYIENAQLAMAVYVVAELGAYPTQSQVDMNKKIAPRGGEGHIFQSLGRWWEVLMLTECRGDHVVLQTTYKNVQAMVELAQRMQDKLRVFKLSSGAL